MKKNLSCCLMFALSLSLVCIAGIYLITYTIAAQIADSLCCGLDQYAWKWILGEEGQVGHPEMGFSPVNAGKTIGSGTYYWELEYYSGPTSFVCQLPVVYGEMTYKQGYGSLHLRDTPHTGIDYRSFGNDEKIMAPMGGKVTFADWNWWLGWMVVIENDGVQVILGHMCCGEKGKSSSPTGDDSFQVSRGDVISAGTVVGRVGTTGNSTGYHLHYEVRECDSEGKCQIVNPSSVYLPGQEVYCDWEHFEPHTR
jgi:hypothetical protein